MKILIAEDDFASRKYLRELLAQYGECDITVNGVEAVEAFALAHDTGKPYDLLCLDIMMPKIDGLKVIQTIRDFEKKHGIDESGKSCIIITSAINETEVTFDFSNAGRVAYLTKPVGMKEIKEAMKELGLI